AISLLRRGRHAAPSELRHDDPVPAAGRDAIRRRTAATPFLLCRQRLPDRPPAARAGAPVHARRGRAARIAGRRGVERAVSRAPEGTVEVLEVLSASLDAVGLNRAVLGLGDADLYRQLLTGLGVEGEPRARVLDRLTEHNVVGPKGKGDSIDALDAHGRETLLRLPGLR